jgi:hypothetical protein
MSFVLRGPLVKVPSGRDITVLSGSKSPVISDANSREMAFVGVSSSLKSEASMRTVSEPALAGPASALSRTTPS